MTYTTIMNKDNLAIYRFKDQIIETVKHNPVVVIEAPTGSGKTTQIPQILFNAGINEQGCIGVTQPRRIAAVGVSTRISQEMECELGRLVGYKIRFEDHTSAQTKIKIMTDGILLEELRTDPMLLKYSILVVDEAHERSLNIDFILGLLKDILRQRSDFKVVVSSATINAGLFSEYFDDAPIISVETKPFPIELKYMPLKKKDDYEELQNKIVEIVDSLMCSHSEGDILIFLPGEDSIKDCCRRLADLDEADELAILPLYARLGIEEQNKVFDDFPGKRKVVVATNIAETSITINGIIYVIDPGYSKINYYNPRTFTSFLELKPISRASCDQRKGRSGRTAPGIVYRLYSEADYLDRDEYTKEEIYRTDLSEVILRMADFGMYNYERFDFISPPNRGGVLSAIETLKLIGALDSKGLITETGKKMVDYPLLPRLARILVEATECYPEVAYNVLIVISFLSTRSPLLYPAGEEIESRSAQRKLAVKGGDFFSWINLFYKYLGTRDKEVFCHKYYIDTRTINEIVNIHSQLISMVEARHIAVDRKIDNDKIIRCICAGLKQYICKKKDKKPGRKERKGSAHANSYDSATESEIRIHPGSYLYGESPEWIVGGEIVNTGRTYIRTASVVSDKIIKNDFPDIFDAVVNKNVLVPNKKVVLREAATSKSKRSGYVDGTKIRIIDKYFPLVKDKSGIHAEIQYSDIIQLKKQKEQVLHYNFDDMEAVLKFKDVEILRDKLNSLIQYFDKIYLDNGVNTKTPKQKVLNYPDDWQTIFKYLKKVPVPTYTKRNKSKAGFLTVSADSGNTYKFRLEHDFFTSIETSFAAMEQLFNTANPVWNEHEKIVMEQIHHRLSNMAEEIEV